MQTLPPPPESSQTLKEQLYLAGSPTPKHHGQQGKGMSTQARPPDIACCSSKLSLKGLNLSCLQELNVALPVAAKASRQSGSLNVSPTKVNAALLLNGCLPAF